MTLLRIVGAFVFALFVSGCGSGASLFLAPCGKDDPNCQTTALTLSTKGARTDLAQQTIENGTMTTPLSVSAIRKDEKSSLTFEILNARLAPMRDFSLVLDPGTGYAVDTTADNDCSKSLALMYRQTCSVTISYTPALTPPPNQTAHFRFKNLLGEVVDFKSPIQDAKVLSDFYIAGSTQADSLLAFDPSSAGYSERDFVVSNDGSADDILNMNFSITGLASGDFTVVSAGAGFCTTGQTLASNGGTCKIRVRFKPTVSGLRKAVLSLSGNGGIHRNYDLGGMVLQTVSSSANLSFGSQPLAGPSVTKTIQFTAPVTNENAPLGVCSYAVSGDSSFAMSSNTCSATVTAGSTCAVTVRYTPTVTAAWNSGALAVNCNDRGGRLAIPLSAQTNAGPLATDVSIIDFGTVLVGGSTSQILTLSNSNGVDPLANFSQTLTQLAGSGLSLSDSTCGSTLAVGASCTVKIVYKPTAGGSASAVLNATSSQDQLDFGIVIQGRALTPLASQPSIDFGSLLPGSDRIGEPLTLTNPSSTDSLSGCLVDRTALAASGFTLDDGSTCLSTTTLAPGASCSLKPRFTAALPVGARNSQISFTCAVGGSTTISLAAAVATDNRLTVQPPLTYGFDGRLVGIQADGLFTLKNDHATDAASPLIASTASLFSPWIRIIDGTGDCDHFSSLAAGASCTVHVRYSPSATPGSEQTGFASGVVEVSAGSVDPVDPTFSATALKLTASSSTKAFGVFSTGVASDVATFSIQNPSTVDAATGCTASVSSPFIFVSQNCGSTIAAGASCTYSVRLPSQSSSMTLNGSAQVTCSIGGRASTALSAQVIKPATLTWSGTAAFGVVDVGSTQDATFTMTHSGVVGDASTTTLLVGLSSGDPFSMISNNCPAILSPGQSCNAVVRFAPTSPTIASVNLLATDASGNQTLALTGTGVDASLRIVPSQNTFSITGHLVGSSTNQTIQLSNNATAGAAAGLTYALSPVNSAWALTPAASSPCGGSLALGATCNIQVTYQPISAGSTSGTLTIHGSDIGDDKTVSYSGTALEIGASRTTIDFGITDLNAATKTHPTVITVMNPSTLDAATGCAAVFSDPFVVVNNTCGSTLAAGGTCQYQVQMKPVASPATPNVLTGIRCTVGGTASVQARANVYDLPNLVWSESSPNNFGVVDTDGQSVIRSFTLSNTESTTAATLSSIGFSSPSSGFSIVASGTTCVAPMTLPGGSSCVLKVQFHPTADSTSTGGEIATLQASISSPTGFFEFDVIGTGSTMSLTSTESAFTFANKEVGQSSTESRTTTITNTGTRTANLTYTALSAPVAKTGTCGATLAANTSCTVIITATPNSSPLAYTSNFDVTEVNQGTTKQVRVALAFQTFAVPVLRIHDNLANTTDAASISTSDLTGPIDDAKNIVDLSPTSRTVTYTVTNTAANSSTLQPPTVALVYKSDSSDRMVLFNDTCTGSPLLPLASCTFSVRYSPQSTHETSVYKLDYSAASSVTTSSQTLAVANIVGTSVKAAKLTLTNSTSVLELGPLALNSTVNSSTLQLSNTGDQTALSLSHSFSGTQGSFFTRDTTTCATTLAGGASCSLQIKFAPLTTLAAFSTTFTASSTQSSTQSSVSRVIKAASYGDIRVGAANTGYENDIVSDANRFYIASRKITVGTGQGKYTVMITVCQKASNGGPDPAKCVATNLDTVFSLTNSNLAGNLNGSGPRILESGTKLVIAVQNKETAFGGESTGGTATLITCKKPTITSTADANFDKILSCDKTVIDNTTASGQFASFDIKNGKLALATTGQYNNLLLQVCDVNLTVDPSTFTNCARRDFAGNEQGWYPSLAFNGPSQIVVATYDQSDLSTSVKGVRLNSCSIGTNNALTCSTGLIDTSSTLEFGLYPSLAMSGSKAYVAHQVGKTTLSGMRLSSCTIGPDNSSSGCSSTYVTSTSARGAMPRLNLTTTNIWIVSTRWEPTQTSANRVEVYRCDLATAPSGCSAAPIYAAETSSMGLGPIYNRSAYIDPTKAVLVAPYLSGQTGFEASTGLFVIGLLQEI